MTDDDTSPNPYNEIARLRARLARLEELARAPEFTASQLSDRAFYKGHEQEIHRAIAEPGTPRIVPDPEPIERPAPVYPPSVIEGWTPRGQDIFEPPAPKVKGDKQL